MSGEDIQLTDSVNDPNAANLRTKAPELFNNDVQAPLPGDAEAAAAAAAEGGEGGDAGAGGEGGGDAGGDAGAQAGDDPGKAKAGMIPKGRLDEVIGQRDREKSERERAERERDEMRQRLEAADADRAAREKAATDAAARDIQAEIDAIEDQYDNGDLDVGEYRTKVRALQRELNTQILDKATKAAEERVAKGQQEDRQAVAQQSHADALASFLSRPENKSFNDSAIAATALNAAMQEARALEPERRWTHADLFEAGRARMVEMGMIKAADAAAATGKTPKQLTEEARARASAAANGAAAAMPDRPAGGMGQRGAGELDLDPANMGTKEWAKLPEAERNRLLGK